MEPSPISACRTGNDAEHVLQQMNLREKVGILSGSGMWESGGVQRLGIQPLRMTDGPHGARGLSTCGDNDAVLVPCEIALASTFNDALIEEVGVLLGEECLRRGANILLGPCLNLHRFPVSGRHFECFSEDPYLAGRAAVAYVRGVQSKGAIACAKHFVCNDQETNRGTSNSVVDERTLREVYLAPFEAAVTEGGVQALMCGYNRVNGDYCTEHPYILQSILREEWGFEGIVMSDWFGNQSTERSISAGLNVEMPGIEPLHYGGYLVEAVNRGHVSMDLVDERCRSVLRAHIRAHRQVMPEPFAEESLLQRAASEACVLLKNEEDVLPLQVGAIRKLAVIGPNAANTVMQGGGSSRVHARRSKSILSALLESLPDSIEVVHAKGCSWEYLPSQSMTMEVQGLITMGTCDASGQPLENMFSSFNDVALGVGSWLCTKEWFRVLFMPTLRTLGWRLSTPEEVEAKALAQDAYNPLSRSESFIRGPCSARDEQLIQEAERAARAADVCILVLGTHGFWELEGVDQPHNRLLGMQDFLVERCAAASRGPVIVVLNVGSPKQLPWLSKVDAVLLTHFGGQEMAAAVADLLLGIRSPCGRLPTTWPSSAGLEAFNECCASTQDTGSTRIDVVYREGLAFGYRGVKGIDPLFPFGHGLSFTEFKYDSFSIRQVSSCSSVEGPQLEIKMTIRNVGRRAGVEVAQLYIAEALPTTHAKLEPSLQGYRRTALLEPDQVEKVTFLVRGRSLGGHFSVLKGAWQLPSVGTVLEVRIGSSCKLLHFVEDVVLT
eukprot:TRINITY_DN2521_c0_g2_i1.p1 TRINITY_DN2521_c0_g2~~TRINITY_DN2521_c0_g2_i1.p1  ORF type:complete len:792 (-),score=52.78 TRINITY_DN2521_c0_g2_i1:123-2462(-)